MVARVKPDSVTVTAVVAVAWPPIVRTSRLAVEPSFVPVIEV